MKNMKQITKTSREIANDDDQLRDDAVNECEGDYSMDDWINDQWYSMSAF